jgi:hypothetical protein
VILQTVVRVFDDKTQMAAPSEADRLKSCKILKLTLSWVDANLTDKGWRDYGVGTVLLVYEILTNFICSFRPGENLAMRKCARS